MIKINLAPARTDWRRLVVPFLMGFSFLGLTLLVAPIVSGQSRDPRNLRIEEFETLVVLTEKLEGRVPDLAPWLRDLRVSLNKNELETQVRRRWFSQELVSLTGRRLTFAPRFFELDSFAQEQALLQVLVTLRSQVPERDESIAFGE